MRAAEEVMHMAGRRGRSSSGGSGKARSAITGRYVRKSTARSHPKTTVVERSTKKR
jgi:hypothetical protein